MVKNPPAHAGDMGLIFGPGKIPHATEQTSPCPTTTEPTLYSLRSAIFKRSHCSEKLKCLSKDYPLASTRESSCTW